RWPRIKSELVQRVNASYDVFVPTGRRPIDPSTQLGALLIREAAEAGIDVNDLADALGELWRAEREASRGITEAPRAATRRTGLTVHRINQLENQGCDHTSVARLDVIARELATAYPALGLNCNHDGAAGYDDRDYAALLWDILREPDRPGRPKHDPGLI